MTDPRSNARLEILESASKIKNTGRNVAPRTIEQRTIVNSFDSDAVLARKPYWKTVMQFLAVYICIFAAGKFLLQTPPYVHLTPSSAIKGDVPDTSQSSLPIIVRYRPALIVPGIVLKVSNRSDRPLSLLVTLTGYRHESAQQYTLDIEPLSTHAIGNGEALALGPGDTVQITQRDYRPWESRIP